MRAGLDWAQCALYEGVVGHDVGVAAGLAHGVVRLQRLGAVLAFDAHVHLHITSGTVTTLITCSLLIYTDTACHVYGQPNCTVRSCARLTDTSSVAVVTQMLATTRHEAISVPCPL